MRNFSWLVLISILILTALPAMASSIGSGGSLPWETPLNDIKDSLTGPVATAIGMMGFVIAGATLVFGGDLSQFARSIMLLILAVSVLLGAGNLLSRFSGSGALISEPHPVRIKTTDLKGGQASWN